MSECKPIGPTFENGDQMVYFALQARVTRRVLMRIQTFLLDGATGNVQLNIRDGEILGAHINEIVAAHGPGPRRRRTA
jgi:hypothetical protein